MRSVLVGFALVALLCVLAPRARAEVGSRLHDAGGASLDGAGTPPAVVSSKTPEVAPAPSLPHLTIPDREAVTTWAADPLHLALLVSGVVFLLLVVGGLIARLLARRRPRELAPLPPAGEQRERTTPATAARALAAGSLAALACFGVVAAVSWTRAETVSKVVPAGYTHSGTFRYEGDAYPGAAYPSGGASTGDPIFRRLVQIVRFDFDYRLKSANPTKVRGAIGLELRLTDPATGWTRTVSLARPTPFIGVDGTTTGTMDLSALARMQQAYRSSTGAAATSAVVSIVPQVDITGYSGDTVIDRRFAPELTFLLDKIALVPRPRAAGTSAMLEPTLAGMRHVDVPARLAIGGVGLDVSEARSVALLGVGTSLVALLLAGLLLLLRRGSSERDRIAARFGKRIVSAREAAPDGRWVSELASIEELMRVAEAYDRVVLRIDEGGADTYLVDDGVALYRYSTAGTSARGASRALAVDHG